MNIQIINTTDQNLDVPIVVSRGQESDSSNEPLFSMDQIKANPTESKSFSLNQLKEDFAIVITIKDTAQSFYYNSVDRLEYLNIDIQFNQSENGTIIMDGTVKNKKSLGVPSIEKLEPLELTESPLSK
ncbi:hypothetical protein [Clostridium minihomine]|uniref:hypothetical protein n=1 Tax=Clostridium minihomine TaxID=2045012 RepID=UPI000C768B89|nr:hypothetical protein [Clostridium minihomine]